MSLEVYVVVESSRAGDSVIGAFSTVAAARRSLPVDDLRSLENYRVELHLLDEPSDMAQAWRVSVDKDGANVEVSRVILCSCEDDEAVVESGSYIEDGGKRMQLIVWSRTPGLAIAAVERCREFLLRRDIWRSQFVQLSAIAAEDRFDQLDAGVIEQHVAARGAKP